MLDKARDLHRAGRLRDAIAAYHEVVITQTASDPAAAATAHNNACLIHLGFAEYDQGLEECQQALELRRNIDDDRRLARTLNNLAIVQQNLGAYAEATASLTEALEINTRRGDLEAQVFNLGNLGSVATLAGRYGEALETFGRIERLATDNPDSSWSQDQLRIAMINRGVVLEKLTAYREALDLYRQALVLGEDTDLRNQAHLHLNMGVVLRNLGDPVTAASEFRKAADLFEEAEDRAGLGQTLLNLALAYHLNLDSMDEAEEAYSQALDLAGKIGDRPLEIEVTFYLGQFLLDSDRLDDAESIFNRCREVSETSGSLEGRWSALAGLGRIGARRGDLVAARDLLLEAVAEIEEARSEVADSRLRERFFGDKRRVFESAVQVLADLERSQPDAGHARLGFEVVQRAKVRSLLDSLGEKSNRLAPLSATEIEAAVSRHPILEYFVAERDLLVWVVDKLGLRLVNLGPAAEILEPVATLYRALTNGDRPAEELLRTLSMRLVPEFVAATSPSAILRIAPDAGLRYLPFEILADPRAADRRLVDSLAVIYLPSSSIAASRATNNKGEMAIAAAGFARPGLDLESAGEHSPTAVLASRFRLEPLPATERELEAIASWLPTPREMRIGTAATEAAYSEIVARGAQVVHIATHTLIDELSGASAILLHPVGSGDGLLYPSEIADRGGLVDLTVLAACTTAVDPGNEVGALTTLTGAFLAGGSSAVLATLWDVGDAATAVFMEQFYYQLGRGLTVSEALRKTKLKLLRDPEWSHPALWAGYVLIGDSHPFPQRYRARAFSLALVLAVMLVGSSRILGGRKRPNP